MGDIVNLNKYRKERQREAEKRAARDNRVRYGRTGLEKAADHRTAEEAGKVLDGKKRDPGHDAGKAEEPPETPKPKSK